MRLRWLVAVPLVLTGLIVLPARAACGVSVRGTDPGYAAINAAIDQAAARRQVPPYLLKAMAWHESHWHQFDAYGRPVLSPDCAIGVLQVLARGFDAGRLASDYRYNVDAGAQVLAAKMSASSANVPRSLGSDDRRVGENWYRAAYRYNGWGSAAAHYADLVFATVAAPPDELRSFMTPVGVTNPRNVIPGYTPTNGRAYVAHLDGTWASSVGTYRHGVVRADWLAGAARTTAGKTLEGDQRSVTAFAARNLGWATWTTSRVSLSTQPVGRGSTLYDPRWLSKTRPVALSATTPPGAEGRFVFPVKAANPTKQVSVEVGFVPVVDGTVSLHARGASNWTLNPAHAPTARVASAPAYVTDASTRSAATIGLAFSDPAPGSGVAYVEVGHRAPGATTWSVTHTTATRTTLSLSGAGGHEVRVRAVDKAGHASAWTSPRAIVVPRDNTDATLTFDSRWTATDDASSWLGTLATGAPDATVTTTVNGAAYALIGPRGPGLASLSVYLDDVLVTVVDPVADTTSERQVLWHDTLTPGDHTLRVVAGAGVAYVDAVAVS